jgi:hypothetical protein
MHFVNSVLNAFAPTLSCAPSGPPRELVDAGNVYMGCVRKPQVG